MVNKQLETGDKLDFDVVTEELYNVIEVRRKLLGYLEFIFVGALIGLFSVFETNLGTMGFYFLLLVVFPGILGFMVIRQHMGMIINGIHYAKVLLEHGFQVSVDAASKLNWYGVSVSIVLLAALISGSSMMLFVLTLGMNLIASSLLGLLIVLLMLYKLIIDHASAVKIGIENINTRPVDSDDNISEKVETHTQKSVNDANEDMLTVAQLPVVILFAFIENRVSFSDVTAQVGIFSAEMIQQYGALLFLIPVLFVSVVSLSMYFRLVKAVASMSILLSPTDQPYKPWVLTQSFLGYLFPASMVGFALFLFLGVLSVGVVISAMLSIAVFVVLVIGYNIYMLVNRRRRDKETEAVRKQLEKQEYEEMLLGRPC